MVVVDGARGMRGLAAWSGALLAAAAMGCAYKVDYYCDESTPCLPRYPDRPYCDLRGDYNENSNTCVPNPAADVDAAVGVDAALEVDAPPRADASLEDGGGVDAAIFDAPPPDAAPIDAAPPVVEIGWRDPFPGAVGSTLSKDVLLALPVAIGERLAIVEWGVIAAAAPASTQVRMALYDDAAGAPGNLAAQSPSWDLSAAEAVAVSGPIVDAGNYWLAVQLDTGIQISASPTGGVNSCGRIHDFDQPLPSGFGSATCVVEPPKNLYLVLQPE